MPVRIECPKCAVGLVLPDSMKGKTVKITCKKCGTAFSVGKNHSGVRPEERGSKAGPPPVPDGIRPERKATGSPAARRGADRDLNFDDRPSRRPAARRSGPNWLLIGGIGGGVAAIALGLVLFFVLRGPSLSDEEKALADAKRDFEALAKGLKGKLPKEFDGLDPSKFDPKSIFKDPKSEPPERKSEPPEPEPKSRETPVVEKKDPIPEPPPPKDPITLKLEGGVRHLALSPDGKLIAVAWNKLYDSGLNVYQWPDLALKQQWLKTEVGGARGLSFAADSKTILAVHADIFSGPINAFDAGSGKAMGTLVALKNSTNFVTASPDGNLLVAGNKHDVKAWTIATGKEAKSFSPSEGPKIQRLEDARFTPDGKLLFLVKQFSGTGQVRSWDPASGVEAVVASDIPGYVNQMAVTRDGGKFLVVFENSRDGGGVRCWERGGKEIWTWKPPTSGAVMQTIALSPDAKVVAVGGNSSTIRVLDMNDGKVLGGFKNPNFQVYHLAFHTSGKLISGDDAIRIWDLAEMRPVDVPKDPVVVKKEDDKPPPPKGPEVKEHRGAVVQHLDYMTCTFQVDGKPLRVERLKETAWFDAAGAPISDSSPRHFLLAIAGNIADIKVRSEGGKQFLLEMKLVKAISDVPVRPGNFELKGARVKVYGGRRMIFIDAAGKEHSASVDALGICYDKTGAFLDPVEAARIFKVDNVVDVWLFPVPGRDWNHVNVARLVSGELMNDVEVKTPFPEPARTEKFTGKLNVKDAAGKKEYSLGIFVMIGKKKGYTHRNLLVEGDPKAFDMKGNPIPWTMIFHHNNELEVTMETRGVFSVVKEAKLIGGVMK